MLRLLRWVLGVVVAGVLVAWLADGLDPLCGPQRCSGLVTPYALTGYHEYAAPWMRTFVQDEILAPLLWWQNGHNLALMLVCFVAVAVGGLVAMWAVDRADSDHPLLFAGGALTAVCATGLVARGGARGRASVAGPGGGRPGEAEARLDR